MAFMLDQCHNIEPKIPGQIRSVMNVQEATAKALLVDQAALAAGAGGRRRARRERGPDGRLQHRRPAAARRAPAGTGLDADPMAAYARSGLCGSASPRSASAASRRAGAHEQSTRSARHDPRGPAEDLLDRSHRLGADPRNTNYAGGNTSAKGTAIDPVTGTPVELLWVKGSGRRPRHADRGRPGGPAARPAAGARRRLPGRRARGRDGRRVRLLPPRPRRRGARRSTPRCTGWSTPPTSTTSTPTSGIALATAADGEALTRACFGDRVAWVPWRRPGFQLGLDIAAIARDRPDAIGAILGGHGITAWGDTSDACEANSLEIIRHGGAVHRRRRPAGAVRPASSPDYEPLPAAERRARAAALLPLLRGLVSTDQPQVGHFTDSDVVLDFLAREQHPRLAALGTSCPDHFLRTKVRPMVLDLPPTRAARGGVAAGCASCTRRTATTTRAYYERHAIAGQPADARRRSGDRARARRRACSASGRPSRPRASPASSTSTRSTSCAAPRPCRPTPRSPSRRSSGSSTGRWRRPSSPACRTPRPLATRIALVTGGGSGIGKAIAHRLAAEGACVVVADIDGGKRRRRRRGARRAGRRGRGDRST